MFRLMLGLCVSLCCLLVPELPFGSSPANAGRLQAEERTWFRSTVRVKSRMMAPAAATVDPSVCQCNDPNCTCGCTSSQMARAARMKSKTTFRAEEGSTGRNVTPMYKSRLHLTPDYQEGGIWVNGYDSPIDVVLSGLDIREEALDGYGIRRFKGLAPSTCFACWSDPQRMVPRPTSPVAKLINGPGVHVEWVQEEAPGCPQYPAVFDEVTGAYYYGPALVSFESLNREIEAHAQRKGVYQATAPNPFGFLDRQMFRLAIALMGPSRKIPLENPEPLTFVLGPHLTFHIPANFTPEWRTTAQKGGRLSFPKQPFVRTQFLDQPFAGIALTPERATLNIDWWPDVTIEPKK